MRHMDTEDFINIGIVLVFGAAFGFWMHSVAAGICGLLGCAIAVRISNS